MTYLLPLLLVVPIFGAILAAVIPRAEAAKIWAMAISAITAVLAIGVWIRYPFCMCEDTTHTFYTFAPLGFSLSLGVDAISLFLVLLAVLLVPLAICASFDSITDRPGNITPGCLRCSPA